MGSRHFAVLGSAIAIVCGVASAQEAPPPPGSTAAFPDAEPDAAASVEPTPAPDASASAAPEAPPIAPAPPAAPTVTPAPVAPEPVAPAPAAPPPTSSLGMAHTVSPREPRSGIVGGLRLGFLLTGGGSLDFECSGQCSAFTTTTTDYDDESSFVLGGDLLFHLSPNLRLGAAALFVPDTRIRESSSSSSPFANPSEESLGKDLSVMAAIEGVFDTGPTTAVAVRGQGGLMVLFPGGDLQNGIDQLNESCDQGGTKVCTVDDGPYVGPTLGAGPGMIFALQSVSVRVDLWFQWFTVPNLLHTKGSSGVTDLDVSNTWSGTRLLLSGGLEF